jgi:hypothetical protein
MKTFNLEKELSKKITPKRMQSWRWASCVSGFPKNHIQGFADIRKPALGDLALVQVISLGSLTSIEEPLGGPLSIFPGTVLVGAFANRYAPDVYEGIIPESFDDSLELDLLNIGGVLGTVISRNSAEGLPTKVKLLAFLKDKNGNIANTLNYSFKPKCTAPEKQSKKVIVVTGTSMNSGKSNTAKAIVYALTSSGHSVVAGKVTGSAAKKDIWLMKTAGAMEICDFTDFGYPSTYLLSEEKTFELFWNIYSYLSEKCEKNGYIVLEIADGILQRETELLLSHPKIKNLIDHLVFSCCDSLSAIAGVRRISDKFGLNVCAVSGPAANSPLGLREMRTSFKDLPAFNNMVLDVNEIIDIFTDTTKKEQEIIINPEAIPEFATDAATS